METQDSVATPVQFTSLVADTLEDFIFLQH